MRNIWSETIQLGLHPDAGLTTTAGLSRNDYRVGLVVEAFWAEEQRVLLVTASPSMDEGMRELPSLSHEQRLERLHEGRDWAPAAVVRRAIGVVDAWADSARAHLKGLLPFWRCWAAGCCAYGEGRYDERAALWRVPPGWLRLENDEIRCPDHGDCIKGDHFKLGVGTSHVSLVKIVERG